MPKSRSKIPLPEQRLIPVSAEAVQKGFESTFDDLRKGQPDPFVLSLNRFKNNQNLYGHINSPTIIIAADVLVPTSASSGNLSPENARQAAMLGGAALYMDCIKQEARLRKTSFPRIKERDVLHWGLPYGLALGALIESGLAEEEGAVITAEALVDNIGDTAAQFQIDELDFCMMALQYFDPARGFENVHRQHVMFGAAMVYDMYQTHYDLNDLEAALS